MTEQTKQKKGVEGDKLIQGNGYGIAPTRLILDNRLDSGARNLYILISSLTNQKGYCWASNYWFAEQFEISPRTVIRWINELVTLKYLKRVVLYKPGTTEIVARHLFLYIDHLDPEFGQPRMIRKIDKTEDLPSATDGTTLVTPMALPSDTGVTVNTISINTKSLTRSKNISLIDDPIKALPNKEIKSKTKKEIEEIFEYWKVTLNKKGHRLTGDKIRKIKARLDEGFTVDQLKTAILGVSKDKFSMGDNDRQRSYNGFETIFKTGSKVETFIEYNDQVVLSSTRVVHNNNECPICRDLGISACILHKQKSEGN